MDPDNNPALNNITTADEGAIQSPIKKKKKLEVKAKSKQTKQAITDAAASDPSLLPPPPVKRSHATQPTTTEPAAASADTKTKLTQEEKDANTDKTSSRTAKKVKRAKQKILKAA
eukprot:scaffold363004_cov24-Attheya_sp.AAC.1